MVGILLALQVNSWNEDRKERKEEKAILSGIRADLLRDTIDLQFNMRAYEKAMKIDSSLLDHLLERRPFDADFLNGYFTAVVSDWSLVLHQSHFEEAKGKGWSIIRDRGLRSRISRLYEFRYPSILAAENESESFAHRQLVQSKLLPYLSYDEEGLTMLASDYERLLDDGNLRVLLRLSAETKRYLLEEEYRPVMSELLAIERAIAAYLETF